MNISGTYPGAQCQRIANTAKPHTYNSSQTLDCIITKVKNRYILGYFGK